MKYDIGGFIENPPKNSKFT